MPQRVATDTPAKLISSSNSNSPSPRVLQLVHSKNSAAQLRKSMASLRASLPSGALSYFYARRVGRGYGFSITCPHCEARPDSGEVQPWNRWRWLSMHIAAKHTKAPTKVTIEGKLQR